MAAPIIMHHGRSSDDYRRAASFIERNRRSYITLQTMLSLVQPRDNPPQLIAAVVAHAKELHADLLKTHEMLRDTPYPYQHNQRGVSIAGYALEKIPGPDDVSGIFNATENMLSTLYDLYLRIMGDVAQHCMAYEKSLGLSELPMPQASA